MAMIPWCKILLFLVSVEKCFFFCHAASDAVNIEVLMTACRALCLDTFETMNKDISSCKFNPDCRMCWETCELFYTDFETWAPMCNLPAELCHAGCQTSCAFVQTTPSLPDMSRDYHFSTQPIVKDTGLALTVQVPRPMAIDSDKNSNNKTILYVVMLRDAARTDFVWEPLLQAVSPDVYIDHSFLGDDGPTSSDQLLMLAISAKGIIGKVVFRPTNFFPDQGGETKLSSQQKLIIPKVALKINLGFVYARVSAQVLPKSKTTDDMLDFQITFSPELCGVQPDFGAMCSDIVTTVRKNTTSKLGTPINIGPLPFNTVFWVRILSKNVEYRTIATQVITPICPRVDPDLKQSAQNKEVFCNFFANESSERKVATADMESNTHFESGCTDEQPPVMKATFVLRPIIEDADSSGAEKVSVEGAVKPAADSELNSGLNVWLIVSLIVSVLLTAIILFIVVCRYRWRAAPEKNHTIETTIEVGGIVGPQSDQGMHGAVLNDYTPGKDVQVTYEVTPSLGVSPENRLSRASFHPKLTRVQVRSLTSTPTPQDNISADFAAAVVKPAPNSAHGYHVQAQSQAKNTTPLLTKAEVHAVFSRPSRSRSRTPSSLGSITAFPSYIRRRLSRDLSSKRGLSRSTDALTENEFSSDNGFDDSDDDVFAVEKPDVLSRKTPKNASFIKRKLAKMRSTQI